MRVWQIDVFFAEKKWACSRNENSGVATLCRYYVENVIKNMSHFLLWNVLRCEDCGKTEFFIYDLEEIREARKNEQELG
ncbi:MAG: hypothetical protein IJO13_11100 [Lachnospiraceae bacterium]|nr:hypothetical protein [Lachnospiraceae bacterium]